MTTTPRTTWTYAAGYWHLHVAGRVDPVFTIASNHRPTRAETERIIARLRPMLRCLREAGREERVA